MFTRQKLINKIRTVLGTRPENPIQTLADLATLLTNPDNKLYEAALLEQILPFWSLEETISMVAIFYSKSRAK